MARLFARSASRRWTRRCVGAGLSGLLLAISGAAVGAMQPGDVMAQCLDGQPMAGLAPVSPWASGLSAKDSDLLRGALVLGDALTLATDADWHVEGGQLGFVNLADLEAFGQFYAGRYDRAGVTEMLEVAANRKDGASVSARWSRHSTGALLRQVAAGDQTTCLAAWPPSTALDATMAAPGGFDMAARHEADTVFGPLQAQALNAPPCAAQVVFLESDPDTHLAPLGWYVSHVGYLLLVKSTGCPAREVSP